MGWAPYRNRYKIPLQKPIQNTLPNGHEADNHKQHSVGSARRKGECVMPHHKQGV